VQAVSEGLSVRGGTHLAARAVWWCQLSSCQEPVFGLVSITTYEVVYYLVTYLSNGGFPKRYTVY